MILNNYEIPNCQILQIFLNIRHFRLDFSLYDQVDNLNNRCLLIKITFLLKLANVTSSIKLK